MKTFIEKLPGFTVMLVICTLVVAGLTWVGAIWPEQSWVFSVAVIVICAWIGYMTMRFILSIKDSRK